jgi:AsmA protein
MRALKIAGLIAAGVLVLVIGALALAWALFDPNAYKTQVQSAFRDATGRELRLDGELKPSVFPWLAVETGAASVANRAGFGEEPFAALRHARLGVRLWPLLTSRRVEFGPVHVEGLQVNLAVARDGTSNWSDLLDRLQPKEAQPAPDGTEQPVDLSIARLELEDADLTYDDRQAGTPYAIGNWNLRTGPLRRGQPFDVATDLDASRNRKPLGRFEFETRVDPTEAGKVKFGAGTGRMSLPRQGRDEDLVIDLRVPAVVMQSASRDIAVDGLELHVGPARIVTTFAVAQASRGSSVKGKFTLAETNPRELFRFLGVDAPRTRDAKVLEKLAASGNLRYGSGNGLQLDGLDLRLDDTRLGGRVGIADFDRMAVRFDLDGSNFDVDRYLPPSKDAPKDETAARTNAGKPNDRSGVRALDLAGSLALTRLTVAAIPLADVTAKVRVRDGKVSLDPLQASAFRGRSVTKLDYDLGAAVPTLRVDQRLDGVDVAALLGTLAKVRPLEGTGDATFTLATHGDGAAALFANVSGPFDIRVSNGALVGTDLWYEIQRAISTAQLKSSALTLENSGRTAFERMTARGTLRNRTLVNDRMEFVTDFAVVKGRGDVDYGANHLDLDLTARLLKTPSGRLFGVKVSRLQDAPIPLTVGGTLQEPKVRPDVSELLEAVAKDTLQQPLEEKVKKKLEKLFGL